MNENVANLINVDCTYKANVVENAKLLLNEHVHGLWDATLKFSKWTDLLLVMRVPDIERRKKLQAELKQICHNAPPIAAKNEMDIEKLKGHLVACQFSRDGCYYRALVTGVKPDKARLQFIDFGNVEGTLVIKLRNIYFNKMVGLYILSIFLYFQWKNGATCWKFLILPPILITTLSS